MFSKTYILLHRCQTCFSVFSLLQNSLENKSSFNVPQFYGFSHSNIKETLLL